MPAILDEAAAKPELVRAFTAWAEEFNLRPHHRCAKLLDPALIDQPRIGWHAKPEETT